MSTISTGTLTTSGSTTYVSGTTSGLDTDSLVENAVASYTAKADTIDIKVEENQSEIEAYEEYYGLSLALQDSLESLKSNTSYASDDTSVFQTRTGTLSSDGDDASGLITATIDEDSSIGTYEITVVQKAEEMVVQGQSIETLDDPLVYEGVFEIGLDNGESVTINVDEEMSLQDIASAINASSSTSGVSASILKVSETQYALILAGQETNTDITVATQSGTILSDLGLTDGADAFLDSQITQEAQESIIRYNSTLITREDNSYDDLIEGVSLEITGANEDTTISLTIDNDTSTAKTAITEFIDAYNALRDFFLTNQSVDSDGSVSEDAVLFSETMLETLSSDLSRLLSSTSYEDGSVQTMHDLGIGFDEDNKLAIDDETALDEALLSNFDEVAGFFSTSVTTGDSSLAVVSNTSQATSLEATIHIEVDENGDISSAYAERYGYVFEVKDSRLVGKDDSVFEGITLAYVGDEDAIISFSMTAGLGDLIYNKIEPYTNVSSGLIQEQISSLQGTNDDLEAEAEEIRLRGEDVREREILKYATMETKLAIAKALITQIQAILGTSDDD